MPVWAGEQYLLCKQQLISNVQMWLGYFKKVQMIRHLKIEEWLYCFTQLKLPEGFIIYYFYIEKHVKRGVSDLKKQ